jgi:hypothetical protein
MLKRLTTAEEAEWFCRLTIQLFNLSETAFRDPRDLEHFKRLQMSLVESLRECRDVQLELATLIDGHTKEVESGSGAVSMLSSGHIHVSNDIEPKLNRLFKDFFSKARTALYHLVGQKDTPESVTYFLLDQRSISFVQVKEDAMFEKCAAKFLQDVPGEKAQGLMNMVRGDRATWLSTLIRTRDRINHDIECPQLRMTYGVVGGELRAGFPTVSGQELRQYLTLFWENLYQAVEETVLVCIAMRMPDNFVPCRIPDDRVDPKLPFRWCFAFRPNPADNS